MKTYHPKCILFDLDGTVIDSCPGVFGGIRYALERMGDPCPDEEVLYTFIGPSVGPRFRALFGYDDGQTDRAVTLFREYYGAQGWQECTLYPGLRELFAELCAAGYRLALATKKPQEFTERIVSNLGLTPYFQVVCGAAAEDTHDSKAYILETALKKLNCTPEDTVMVGDTRYDAEAAIEVGMPCIGVLYGFADPDALRAAGMAELAKTTEELGKILGLS